jgi:hypothetical protein
VRLAAALRRRREIMGIVDWLEDEAVRHGVALRTNTFAERAEVMAEAPDVVVVATGGLPNTGFLREGEDLATTGWDILAGQAVPGRDVLVYDDNGSHPGFTAAEYLAESGSHVHFVTPERVLAPDIGGTNYPAYLRAFGRHGMEVTLNRRLLGLRRNGNNLKATLWDDYAKADHIVPVDQVVVEHGTLPFDDLYFDLKDGSLNRGEVDHDALLAGRPQEIVRNFEGTYRLFRIGDAVAGRNIHAAIYDALRLMKDV